MGLNLASYRDSAAHIVIKVTPILLKVGLANTLSEAGYGFVTVIELLMWLGPYVVG